MYQLNRTALNKVFKAAKKDKKGLTKKRFFEVYNSGNRKWFSEEFGWYYAHQMQFEYVKFIQDSSSHTFNFQMPMKGKLIPNFQDLLETNKIPGYWVINGKYYSFESMEGVSSLFELKEFNRMYLNWEKEVIVTVITNFQFQIKRYYKLESSFDSMKRAWIEVNFMERGLCYFSAKNFQMDIQHYDFIQSKMIEKDSYWIYPPNRFESDKNFVSNCELGWSKRLELLSECLKENAQKLYDNDN